jgi:hypothetical protein
MVSSLVCSPNLICTSCRISSLTWYPGLPWSFLSTFLKHLDVSVDYGEPFLGNLSGPAQRDARCDEEAARSADYDEPGTAGLLDCLDEAVHNADDLASVVRWRTIGRDDGVPSLDEAGGLCRIAEVVLDCGVLVRWNKIYPQATLA